MNKQGHTHTHTNPPYSENLAADQTRSFANSVDPGETSRLIWVNTVCHSGLDLRITPLNVTMNISIFLDGIVFFKNSGVKGLNETHGTNKSECQVVQLHCRV